MAVTATTPMSPQEVLERARALIVLNHPFYSVLLLNSRTRITTAIPTAAASANEILVNPDFYCKLNKKESIAVLLHEVLHMAFSHVTRRGNRNIVIVDPAGNAVTLWNISVDIVVNQTLTEGGYTLPKGCVEPEERYKGWSAEEVYEALEKQLKSSKNKGQTGKEMSGYKWVDDHIEGQSGPGEKKDDGKSGDGGKDGLSVKELSEAEKKESQQEWQATIEAAATAQRMSGKGALPAGVQKMLDELLNPKIPWDQLLPYLLTTYIPYDYSEVSYDRRLISQGIYVSDLSDTKAQVAVGIDTSGSISDDDIKQFLSEILGILNTRNVSSVRCMTCDAQVHEDEIVKIASDIPIKISGRGGTNFNPVFELLEETKPQLLVYITDGEGDYPKEAPSYPVLWVLSSHKSPGEPYYPPFGYVAYLDLE